MSTTPTTFTIQNTGIYRMTDGSATYWFEAGTIIPMYLAIALGIEGAGYDPVPVFNSDQTAAINELINASGGGGGATFPMAEGVWYDNSTAVGGEPGTGNDIDADTVAAGIVQITAADVSITAVTVEVTTGPSGAATMRCAIYAIGDGLAVGDRVGNEATVELEIEETGVKTFTLAAETPPGLYAVVITGTEFLQVSGFMNSNYYSPISLGLDEPNGEPYTGWGSVSVAGAHTALPATLAGSAGSAELSFKCPYVLFQITHD